MPQTIVDILTSNSNNLEGEYSNPDHQEKHSICKHLQRLLNCRRDSLSHRPDFGMPDIAELYMGLPYTIDVIVASISQSVQQFEPRIQHVQVRELDIKPGRSITHFELLGQGTTRQPLRYIISLCRNGRIEVKTSEEFFSHV